MSRFDMKEFGEAAPFLRKSELELLTAHTVPFDGKATYKVAQRNNVLLTYFIFRFNLFHLHEGNKSPAVSCYFNICA